MVYVLLVCILLLIIILAAYLEGKFREISDRFDELETILCELIDSGSTPARPYIDESPAEDTTKKIKNTHSRATDGAL